MCGPAIFEKFSPPPPPIVDSGDEDKGTDNFNPFLDLSLLGLIEVPLWEDKP